MKNIDRSTVKSITHKALLVSMVLHVFLLLTIFYFTIRDNLVLPFQDRVDASILTLPKPVQLKKPTQPPIRQSPKPVYQSAKPLTEVRAINPRVALQSEFSDPSPVITEQPRLEHAKTAPDVKTDISTALEIPEVDNGLSSVEAAAPTLGGSLGAKRTGMIGVQRAPSRSTLDVAGSTGTGDGATQIGDIFENKPPLPNISFGNMMRLLASDIVGTSDGGPIDVVFVVDASGSMSDNIKAVAKHLIRMVDVYKEASIDYALGLTQFSALEQENFIQILPLTKDLAEYKREIHEIIVRQDENALDAIKQTVREMKFRATSKKHLIVVTDEPFTSVRNVTLKNIIDLCREFGIYVNVLGLPLKEHQKLASETGGKWHAIPGQAVYQQPTQRRATARTPQAKSELLSNAKWEDTDDVGRALLQNTGKAAVDIVLFIDGSKSMENKLLQLLLQVDVWTREWDNALIDYRMGVVRFRSHESANTVDVYDPPQSVEHIRSIIKQPAQDDENLLHAITDGMRQIKLRKRARTYIIIVTDEPISNDTGAETVIQFLQKMNAIVSVVGTYDNFQQRVASRTNGVWVPIPGGHTTNNAD